MAPKGVRQFLKEAYRNVPEDVRKFFQDAGRLGGQKGGSLGGKTTAARMTPEARKARAKKAAAASAKVRSAAKRKRTAKEPK
jgi:hypothetical protein